MGEVYEATDTRTAQRVAIKVLTEEGTQASARLKREAEHASELDHPNICTVYEVGEDEAGAYIAMEFLDGTNLVDAVPAHGVDPASTLSMALQLAEAIAHAHERNIVHRDLKSANVMVLADGRLKVLDFGLARRLPRDIESAVSVASLTDVGVIAGTLSYLAPELLKGERADSRSDIWAFGIILHELLTGRQPFEGHTPFELTSAILREPPLDLPSQVPTGLRVIHDNCLAKDPADRYRTAPNSRSAARRSIRTPGAATYEITILAGASGARRAGRCRTAGRRLVGDSRTGRRIPSRTISIAVLPFRDTSVATETGYFGDGVAEALIERLGTIESLRVFSRESAMRFRDEKALASIKRELSADMVVRGSLRRATDRIRVTAELVDASTIRPVWQQTYDAPRTRFSRSRTTSSAILPIASGFRSRSRDNPRCASYVQSTRSWTRPTSRVVFNGTSARRRRSSRR